MLRHVLWGPTRRSSQELRKKIWKNIFFLVWNFFLPFKFSVCLVIQILKDHISSTHHWKCQLAKKKGLSIPPIWGCWGPTRDLFFAHGQIKHPPFFEGWWYTGKLICQIWAEWAVCLNRYLWKGWMFYLSMGKKWISSGSTTIPDRWYWKFFFLANWHFQWCVGNKLLISLTEFSCKDF